MTKKISAFLIAALLAFSFISCDRDNDPEVKTETQHATESTADEGNSSEDQTSEEDEKEPVTLKVTFFKGGYGDSWIKEIAKAFENEYPHVTVKLQGDPMIIEKMEAILQSGANLPDVAFLTNTILWRMWASNDQLEDLTDLYEGSAYDTDVPFKDTMNKAAREYSIYRDKAYIIPWSDGVLGMVYNEGMFEKYGWDVPETWEQFDRLAKQIKAEGIAPFVYPGRVITYWDFVVNTMMVQEGGFEFLEETLDMESPEVFKLPARLKAYKQYESWFEKGYMLEGSEALNHTEAQIEFLAGKAAMIPNGSWLENEMRKSLPEDFRMKMMDMPAFEDAKEPDVVYSSVGDIIFVPEKSESKDMAKEFIRFSSSEKMNRVFTRETGALRPFNYSLEGIDVSEFTKSALEVMQNNKSFTFNTTDPMFIRMGFNPAGIAVGSIAFGNHTAEGFVTADYNKAVKKWDEYIEELGLDN